MFPEIVTVTNPPLGGQRIEGLALTDMTGGVVSAAAARHGANSARVITNIASFDFVSVRFTCNSSVSLSRARAARLTGHKMGNTVARNSTIACHDVSEPWCLPQFEQLEACKPPDPRLRTSAIAVTSVVRFISL